MSNIREKIKSFYESDSWINEKIVELEKISKDVFDDISIDEAKHIKDSAKKTIKFFNSLKRTSNYKVFKNEQAKFILTFYDALNSTKSLNKYYLKAKEEINDESNIPSILNNENITIITNIYSTHGDFLELDKESIKTLRAIDANIKQVDYTIDEIIKFRNVENVKTVEPSAFENAELNFDKSLVSYRRNNDLPTIVEDLLYTFQVKNLTRKDYNYEKQESFIANSFANFIGEFLFYINMSEAIPKMNEDQLNEFLLNTNKEEYVDLSSLSNNWTHEVKQNFLNSWVKKILKEENLTELKGLLSTTSSYLPTNFNKVDLKNTILNTLYHLNEEGKDKLIKDIFEYAASDLKNMQVTPDFFNEYIKEKNLKKKIKNGSKLFSLEDKSSQIKSVMLNKEEINANFGKSWQLIKESLSSPKININDTDNFILVNFIHPNIHKISDETAIALLEDLVIELVYDISKMNQTSFLLDKSKNEKDLYISSKLNKCVLDNILMSESNQKTEVKEKKKM